MKNYILNVVGNDTFDRSTAIQANSLEEAVLSIPHILELYGRMTIEQFVKITLREVK